MMQAGGITRSTPAAAPLELRGRSLVVARFVWSAVVVQATILFAVSIPARYTQLSHPPADVRVQLTHAGLSTSFYASYLTAIGCILALVCCAVAALIVWHRPNDRIGLLGSLYLVLFSLTNSPQMHAVATAYPSLALPANLSLLLLVMFLVAFSFVFPDGQVVPHWARIPILVYGATATLMFLLTGASIAQNPPGWLGMMLLGGGITGIAAQIYRYFWVSDSLQRQQTKWVVLGVSGAIVTTLVFAFIGPMLPSIGGSDPDPSYDLTGTTGIVLTSLFVPLTLGLAILHYRLWDIDVVVNRTLVYGTLTAGLVGLYLLVVNGFGALVQARIHLPISLLATALVAVLFAPLRGRLQSAVNRLMYGERDDPYRVLIRLGERVGAALTPEAVLPTIAETVAHAMKSPYAAITLRQADVPATSSSQGAFSATSLRLPLEYRGETVGELLVAPRGPGEDFSPADRGQLEDLARQIGPVAHAVRLTADLQLSRERLVTAREEERRRLRRDLHDGLGPQLAALTLKIETIRNRFAKDRGLDAALVDLTERTQTALSDIRSLVYALRPPALDELGLLAAVQQGAEQYSQHGDTGIHITVHPPESLPPLPAAVEVAAYRIVQEALANVVRHSGACTCRISVSLDSLHHVLRLEIVDDGRGLPVPHRTGVGLVSMRERAEELGGFWSVASPPCGGTIVTVELPCPLAQAEITDGHG
jgi:signal transduction histidine kinase